MQIINADPPLLEELDAAFNIKGKAVYFTFGDKIYNPKGKDISPALMAHEQVHCDRQGDDVDGWWRKYIDDPKFRLEEELAAHRVEYQFIAADPASKKPVPGFRSKADYYLIQIAGRLSSPLYGNLITLAEARKAIACPS